MRIPFSAGEHRSGQGFRIPSKSLSQQVAKTGFKSRAFFSSVSRAESILVFVSQAISMLTFNLRFLAYSRPILKQEVVMLRKTGSDLRVLPPGPPSGLRPLVLTCGILCGLLSQSLLGPEVCQVTVLCHSLSSSPLSYFRTWHVGFCASASGEQG